MIKCLFENYLYSILHCNELKLHYSIVVVAAAVLRYIASRSHVIFVYQNRIPI